MYTCVAIIIYGIEKHVIFLKLETNQKVGKQIM